VFPLLILFNDVVVTSCGLLRKEKFYFHFCSMNLERDVTLSLSNSTISGLSIGTTLSGSERDGVLPVEGVPMYRLCRKLRAVKIVLKRQNIVCFGNLKQRILQARDNLDLAQKDVLLSHGSAVCMQKERECLHAYVSITKAEEAFLKQKARNQWLQLGDQNNAFFHRLLKARHARNSINFLWDEAGNKVEDVEMVKDIAVITIRSF
jgi:hypothetical protein